MNHRKFRHTWSVIAGVAVLATTAAAWAATTGAPDNATAENDALTATEARITLTQAIDAAERQVGGKASKAEYERTREGWAYDVEVVRGTQVFDVRVDPIAGTVIASNEDRADRREDRQDREHADRERSDEHNDKRAESHEEEDDDHDEVD